MDSKEFVTYVMEQKRIGLDNSQIARKLGMDAAIFSDACKFAFGEIEKNNELQKIAVEPKPDLKPRKEKVEGIYYVPQNADDEFMNTPIVKSKKEKSEN